MTGQGGEGATIVLDENCTVRIPLLPPLGPSIMEKEANYLQVM